MAVKMIPISSDLLGQTDCIVFRHNKAFDGGSGSIEMSFPFHEDTPNFRLNLREAMELRNAIDEAYGIQLIEGRKI